MIASMLAPLVHPHEVAWAAGFFDAEGSFTATRASPGRCRLRASVPQTGRGDVPVELSRFQAAVGFGVIGGPYKHRQHVWTTTSDVMTLEVAALLSPWLGDIKYQQLRTALDRMRSSEMLTTSRPIGIRSVSRRARTQRIASLVDLCARLHAETQFRTRSLEVAWAAGLFDGDGSTSNKSKRRTNGDAFFTISASVKQSGRFGRPEVLMRFFRATGLGRVYGPYWWRNTDEPGYEWAVQSFRDVVALEQLVGRFICAPKREQTRAAISRFAGSPHRRTICLDVGT